MSNLVERLAKDVIALFKSHSSDARVILGITGIPGAGKSTFAAELADAINEAHEERQLAIVVPMDGYHLSNEELKAANLLDFKGIPDSFDAQAFVFLLQQLRTNLHTEILAPLFDRKSEASIDGGIVIKPEHKVCIVEGNYLLLEKPPWSEAKQYFDQVWFLNVDFPTVYPRLLDRHLLARNDQQARAKIESTDLPNARLIFETKIRADKVVEQEIKRSY